MVLLILKIVLVLLVVCIAAFIVNSIEDANKTTNLLSFTDAMKQVKLPIVTVTNNGREFNFLLDTGSNYSVIDKNALSLFEYNIIEGATGQAYGIEGNIIEINYAYIKFKSGNKSFEDGFQIIDMSGAFGQLKETHKVEVVGIIGCNFLDRYNFILDFNNLIAYTK